MIDFHVHLPLLGHFFSHEDYLCHEDKREKPVLLGRHLFCSWHQHLWDYLRMEWCPSVNARIFYIFSISDISAPCHPINVTNLKRPLDIIHLFQNTRDSYWREIILLASLWEWLKQSSAIFCSGDITLYKEWKKGRDTVRAHRWEWSR